MTHAWSGNRTRVGGVTSERANHYTTAPLWTAVMHITNKRNIKSTYTDTSYSVSDSDTPYIHNHILQTTNRAKYLGIHIHSTLNWNTHINKTAQRANTTSAFLHRNIRTCPRKTKHLAYTTLVRPILEYASIIWDPHTSSTRRGGRVG